MANEEAATALLQTQLQRALAGSFAKEEPVPAPREEAPAATATPAPAAEAAAPEAPAAAAPAPSNEVAELRKQVEELTKLLKKQTTPKPEPRPTVKGVEAQVAELQGQLADMSLGNEVARVLPSLPEYEILKALPELEGTVVAEYKRRQRAAQEAGEGTGTVTVAAVARDLKANLVASYKELAKNAALSKEAGFSPSSQQAPTGTSRALTSDMASSGRSTQTTVAKTSQELLKQSLVRGLAALNR